jgi:hypothetical protein
MDTFHIRYVPREENEAANELARQASGYMIRRGKFLVKWRPTACHAMDTQVEGHKSAMEERNLVGEAKDWRQGIKKCIEDPSDVRDRKLSLQALKYTIVDGDLYLVPKNS